MDNQLLHQFALENKTILVTGASSGIGRQIAIHVAGLGGKVIITGRDEKRLSDTLNLLSGDGHLSINADLTDPSQISSLANAANLIDGIVHAAGIVNPYPTRFIGKNEIDLSFSINYTAPILLMTAMFKQKKINKNSSIVFISSFSSKFPYAAGALYTGSKAALENYAKSLAIENAHIGLRANCVLPAMIKTNMYEKIMEGLSAKDIDNLVKKYETYYLRGIGEPKDVANMVTFLLSDASSWITGQNFIIDGGYLLGLLSKMLE